MLPLLLIDLLSGWLPIGGIAALLIVFAYHGWSFVGMLSKIGIYARVAAVLTIALAGLVVSGVIKGFDVGRLTELVGMGISILTRLLPAL